MRGSEASGPGALFDAPSTLATSLGINPTAASEPPPTDPKLVASNIEHVLLSMSEGNGGLVSVSGNSSGSTGKGILIGVLSAFGSAAVAVLVLAVFFFFKYTQRGRIILDRIGRPGEFDDEQAFAREEAEALETMDDLTRSEYMRAKGKSPALCPFSWANDDHGVLSSMTYVHLSLIQLQPSSKPIRPSQYKPTYRSLNSSRYKKKEYRLGSFNQSWKSPIALSKAVRKSSSTTRNAASRPICLFRNKTTSITGRLRSTTNLIILLSVLG